MSFDHQKFAKRRGGMEEVSEEDADLAIGRELRKQAQVGVGQGVVRDAPRVTRRATPAPRPKGGVVPDHLNDLHPDVRRCFIQPEELVLEPVEAPGGGKAQRVRQAGATPGVAGVEAKFTQQFREAAQKSLYLFTKAVLARGYLTPTLHLPMCEWLTDYSQVRRKLLLFPREHAKTSVVSHGMPLHMQIQQKESNIYFPGLCGSETTLILCCETEKRGQEHIRVQETAWERNALMRALWPLRAWGKPERDARVWNSNGYIIPREVEYPDPTVKTLGVDGAITGAHPRCLLKDDLISLAAAQSPTVMQTAIRWHVASRALINKAECLEITIGTRWAIFDLYAHMMKEDKDMLQYWVRSMIEDGKIIYPELFEWKDIARLQKEFGALFPLLYMNSASDPELVDFDVRKLRRYTVERGEIVFHEDSRDVLLKERVEAPLGRSGDESMRGVVVNAENWDRIAQRGEYMRVRSAA